MSRRVSENIRDLCQETAGPLLRGVFHYDDGEYETVYIREDVADAYTDEELREYFSQMAFERAREHEQEEKLHVGSHHATLRLYDEALILLFPQGTGVGTLISFEPEGCRDMAAFIVSCLATLHQTSPQEIPTAPEWDWL